VWVDVRASEAALVYIEKAEIEIHYFVNASRKVRKLVTPDNATDATPKSDEVEEGEQKTASTESDEAVPSDSDDGDISDEATEPKEAVPGDGTSSAATREAKSATKEGVISSKKPKYITVTEVHVEPRTRIFPLVLSTTFSTPAAPMSKNESLISRDLLRRWRRSDQLHLQKSAARNDLEAYLIWALSDGFVYNDEAVKVVGSQRDMDATAEKLRELQNWLEDAGSESTVPTEDLEGKLRQAKLIVRTALREAPPVDEIISPKAPLVVDSSADEAAGEDAEDDANDDNASDEL
jgi:hypothetical protein